MLELSLILILLTLDIITIVDIDVVWRAYTNAEGSKSIKKAAMTTNRINANCNPFINYYSFCYNGF